MVKTDEQIFKSLTFSTYDTNIPDENGIYYPVTVHTAACRVKGINYVCSTPLDRGEQLCDEVKHQFVKAFRRVLER